MPNMPVLATKLYIPPLCQNLVPCLAWALALAEPEGYVRIFVNEAEPMASLLPMILEAQRKGHETAESDGTSTLKGLLPDQAALHGLLNGVRDLGLPLLSVHTVDPNTEKE